MSNKVKMPIILFFGGGKEEHEGEIFQDDAELYQDMLDNNFVIMIEELGTGFFSATLSHRNTLHDMSHKLVPSNSQFNPTAIFSELINNYLSVDALITAHKIKVDVDEGIDHQLDE